MARRSLRPIGPADRGEVERMWCELVVAHQNAGGFGDQLVRPDRLAVEVASWFATVLDDGGGFGLVSARGPLLLGFIAVARNWRPWLRPPRSATITALWVEPPVRRQGIGKQLVIGARRRLAKDRIDIVDLHAIPSPHAAGQFWQDQGFATKTTYMQRGTTTGPASV